MSQLRDTLIEVQKEVFLKKLLGNAYETTPADQKAHFLSVLGDQIEKDVDKMIREEINTYLDNSPQKKTNKKLSIFVIAVEVILTTLLGFMINANEWYYVAGIGLLMILVLSLPLLLED